MIFGSFLGRTAGLAATTLLGASLLAGCGDDGDGGGDTMNVTTMTTTPSDDSGTAGDDDGAQDSSGSGESGMAACGENPTTSFATDIQPIIEANCVTDCHDPGAAGASAWPILPLAMGDAASNYDKLVDADSPTNGIAMGGYPLVTACDLDNSYLWDKIATGTRIPEGLCKMPLDTYPVPEGGSCADIETMLSQGDLDTIEQWILDGAPE